MQHYKQTTPYTSGPSSLLMVLNHFNPSVHLGRASEVDIWLKSVVLPTRVSSIFALAVIAHKKGIKTKVIVGTVKYKFPNYRFRGYKLSDVKQASYTSKLYYALALKQGVEIEEKDFGFDGVKQLLKKGKLIMLRLDIGAIADYEHEVKYVLITNYKKRNFEIMDPGSTKLLVPEKEVKEAFDNVITRRKRDHRMIIFG